MLVIGHAQKAHVVVTATLRNMQSPSLLYKGRNTCIEGTKMTHLVSTQVGRLDSRIHAPGLHPKLTQLVTEDTGSDRKRERQKDRKKINSGEKI